MRPKERLVWLHSDGHIELTGPGANMLGVYQSVDGTSFIVDRANQVTASIFIHKLDLAVANKRATFTPAETKDEYWAQREANIRAQVPSLASVPVVARIPEKAHLEMDRYFIGAWTWTTPEPVIDVDMLKALEIKKDKLRELRAPKFEPLEHAQRTALSIGDLVEAQCIETKLQALRDVTVDPALATVKTPEELKAVLPEALR